MINSEGVYKTKFKKHRHTKKTMSVMTLTHLKSQLFLYQEIKENKAIEIVLFRKRAHKATFISTFIFSHIKYTT